MSYAHLVLKNANVITMNPEQPRAELVAVKGNRIMLVAGNEKLREVVGAKTRIIDGEGRTVVPGFNDAHCHIFSFLRQLLGIDLSPESVRSIADIKAALHRKAQNTPPGRWLSGTGYNEFYLAEKRCPNRWDMDEVAPDHPVVLSHRSLHACTLNSLALSLAGITRETEDPPGALIDRHVATGEPTGILFEMLGYIREKVMPPLSEEELNEGISLANEHYLSFGITSLQDATIGNNLGRWQIFRRFKDSGKLKSRLYVMSGIGAMSQFQEAGLAPESGDSHLRLGGVKIMVKETTGQLEPSQSELNRQALSAHKAGFQLAIHAIEPATVEAAIAALEYVHSSLLSFPRNLSRTPIRERESRRHRIEHCSVCPPPLLERLRKLKAVIVTQPLFLYYSGERYLATVPSDQQPWLYRIKSMLDSGLTVAASSDSPVVPDNPLVGIYAAITRKAESGQSILSEEGISAEQALAMYTVNAAYASFEEKVKGSIAPGKLADIVVLSSDPLSCPVEQIKDIHVAMTILDGKIVWEA
ncbi:MAG: amidohydrolase [Chloroflexi bacterium]|nr:amidohydrolase [Chloroflexota bacterium]